MASPIPQGYSTITAHLVTADARAAISYYKQAFGAEELAVMSGPGGRGVMHAEIRIGNSIVMLADAWPGMSKSPKDLGGTPVSLMIYTTDVDAMYKRAVDAGATATMPPADMFWGDRYGKLTDPFGHSWAIATHVEDVSPEEMSKRAQAFFASQASQTK